MTFPPPSRAARPLVAALAAALLLLPSPALADPGEDGAGGDLEQAISDYIEAEQALKEAKDNEKAIKEQIEDNEEDVKRLSAQVEDIAAAAYTSGDLGSVTAILGAESLDLAIDRAMFVDYLGEQSAKTVNELKRAEEDLKAEKELLQEQVDDQAEHLGKMEDARDAAAIALAANGGNATTGPSPGEFRAADPAPRNPDGSLPGEGCSLDDPTTGGCISPRTKHALSQANIAGFQRFVGCFRNGSFGEHPIGKACDFSAFPNGFVAEVASGDAKAYGDHLAAWFVENAEALGVKYVIWFNQFWSPGTGWTGYDGGGGDPASDHTNHVHLSMI